MEYVKDWQMMKLVMILKDDVGVFVAVRVAILYNAIGSNEVINLSRCRCNKEFTRNNCFC